MTTAEVWQTPSDELVECDFEERKKLVPVIYFLINCFRSQCPREEASLKSEKKRGDLAKKCQKKRKKKSVKN